MTFQRKTALKIARLVRSLKPEIKVAVGGYDPSLSPEPYLSGDCGIDFIVRGEGELTFRELARALESGSPLSQIPGLSWRNASHWTHNPSRPVHSLEGDEIKLPRRDARVLGGYTMLGRPVDVVETSRGCTFECSFCSIISPRGYP
jgi:radical SAM superfamily enzyme YgiQ (UPF0313 family)